MPTAITMPQLGESVVEGTVVRWLKQPGETVEKLEPLLEIATDKIDTETPAPVSGVLLGILVAEGETVDAGTTLGYIGAPSEAMPSKDEAVQAEAKGTGGIVDVIADRTAAADKPVGRSFISPVVARMAAEKDVDLNDVPGTGMNGRITKKDVLAHIEDQRSKSEDQAMGSEYADGGSSLFDLDSSDPSADEFLQPLTTMRRAIAEHMTRSVQTSPHVTTVHEADMTAVVRHREENKAGFAAKGVALTYSPYFVAAAIAGLKAVPEMNGRFTDEGIVISRRIHVGVAVAVERGLVVPVIRDADERNLAGLARAINEMATRARNGELSPDHLQGGAFTVTVHGVGGSLISTPIINQPQAGILGVGAIVKRPVVRSVSSSLAPSADDAIVIRPICYLSLSFDHRVLDGALADVFMKRVKETLENWTEREG